MFFWNNRDTLTTEKSKRGRFATVALLSLIQMLLSGTSWLLVTYEWRELSPTVSSRYQDTVYVVVSIVPLPLCRKCTAALVVADFWPVLKAAAAGYSTRERGGWHLSHLSLDGRGVNKRGGEKQILTSIVAVGNAVEKSLLQESLSSFQTSCFHYSLLLISITFQYTHPGVKSRLRLTSYIIIKFASSWHYDELLEL